MNGCLRVYLAARACVHTYLKVRKITGIPGIRHRRGRIGGDVLQLPQLCALHTQLSGKKTYGALRRAPLNREKKWRGKDPARIRASSPRIYVPRRISPSNFIHISERTVSGHGWNALLDSPRVRHHALFSTWIYLYSRVRTRR